VNSEQISGLVLAVVLLALAAIFTWRQKRSLQALRELPALSPEDHRYHRNQARRRIAYAVLMLGCVALIVGWFFLEDLLNQSVELFTLYWIAVLLLVLAMIFLAAFDFWAIARFGIRQHRQIQADRRAMLENHAARYRSQRNGHN
jgi:hypothetical protein